MKMFCETELELKIIGLEQMVADRKMKGAKRINQVALSVYKEALKILREDKALQEAWRCEVIEREIENLGMSIHKDILKDLIKITIGTTQELACHSGKKFIEKTKLEALRQAKEWLYEKGGVK